MKKNRFFEIFSTKKSRLKLFLSIVALLEIAALLTVSTFSWVETISAIVIHTTKGTDPDHPNSGTYGMIENRLTQRAAINESAAQAIDLSEYFRPSGGYHLAAASSADGKSFYFPETRVEETTGAGGGNHSYLYRAGTISDQNVNYISFTVRVTTGCNLAFEEKPVIKFGDTVVDDNLVRVSIGLNDDFHIYSNLEANQNVVNAENGDPSPTQVRSFSDYVSGNNKVVTTTNNCLLTINIWIQDPYYNHYSTYDNQTLTIEKFKLVPVSMFTVYAVSNLIVGSTGGTVAVGNGEFGASAVGYVKSGGTIDLHASANATNGFQFIGWSTVNNTTESIITDSDTDPFTYTQSGNVNTLYALFSDEHTLYFKPQFKHPDISNTDNSGRYAAYIWGNNGGTLTKEWYVMTWDSTKQCYKASYKGKATSVIFCYMAPDTPNWSDSGLNAMTDPWQYRYLQTFDLAFPLTMGEYTYIATSRYTTAAVGSTISDFGNNKVLGYWDHSHATVNAEYATGSNSSIGTIKAELKNSSTDSTKVMPYHTTSTSVNLDGMTYTDGTNTYEKKVTLTAAVTNSEYKFDGWYSNQSATTKVSTGNSLTYEATAPDNGSMATYYAKYVKNPFHVSASFNDWTQSDATMKKGSGSEYTYQIELEPDDDDYTFKIYNATSNTNYSNGWIYKDDYLGANGGDVLSSSSSSMTLKVSVKSKYTFHFDSSTNKFWLTYSVSDKCYLSGGFNSWSTSNDQMTYCGFGEYTISKNFSGEFKIYYNGYYGNGWEYHDNYHGASGGDVLSSSGDNMKMSSNNTNTLHFNATTKKFWIT